MSFSKTVKNRAPAPIQISAEQILREAADRQVEHAKEPVVKIHDAEEYQSHLRDRRKQFEDDLRYRRDHIGTWVKYAKFERDNREYERCRSIFERALEVEPRSGELWLRYAETEMGNEFVNRARNVLDRAVTLLPRIDYLWYKYAYLEEMMKDVPKCRAVFERWMEWMPDDNAWLAYARFEMRNDNSHNNAEEIMRRYIRAYPCARAFLRFAKWAEWEKKDLGLARQIYEGALSELEPEEARQARVFKQFAAFEERHGEYERARVLYKHAVQLLHLGETMTQEQENDDISANEKSRREELYKAYIAFEKKHGDRQGIEDVLLTKQRSQYKHRLQQNLLDYDAWFEYAKLEQEHGTKESVREVYEQAVANVPPSSQTKDDYWRRYIYLWIYYAVYEEYDNQDLERASQVYDTCLNAVIPHDKFSFTKIWNYAAQLLVRRKLLTKARKLYGKALGICGKESLFRHYIALELSLGEMDRARTLYNNYVKKFPHKSAAWLQFAKLEHDVGEIDRCRAIYELAISQTSLDMPETLWKAYIDLELTEKEIQNARTLYERLLERTEGHVKVYISYAQMEAAQNNNNGMERARKLLERAYIHFKEQQQKEERVMLLDAWRVLEQQHGTPETIQQIQAKMPRRIKRKRMRDEGWEEYFDYQFPDDDQDANAKANLKILEMAAKWKKQRMQQQDDSDDDSDEDSD